MVGSSTTTSKTAVSRLGVGIGAQDGDMGVAGLLPRRLEALDDLGGGQGRLQEEMRHVQLLEDWRMRYGRGVALVAEEVPAPAFAVTFELVLGAKAARDVIAPRASQTDWSGPAYPPASRSAICAYSADVRGQMQRPALAQSAGRADPPFHAESSGGADGAS